MQRVLPFLVTFLMFHFSLVPFFFSHSEAKIKPRWWGLPSIEAHRARNGGSGKANMHPETRILSRMAPRMMGANLGENPLPVQPQSQPRAQKYGGVDETREIVPPFLFCNNCGAFSPCIGRCRVLGQCRSRGTRDRYLSPRPQTLSLPSSLPSALLPVALQPHWMPLSSPLANPASGSEALRQRCLPSS